MMQKNLFDLRDFVQRYEKLPRKDSKLPLTIADLKDEMSFKEGYFVPALHLGQRKLFITNLQFLTKYATGETNILVIYVGSAPCNYAYLLSELFPNVRFLLIDPNTHIINLNRDVTHFSTDLALYVRAAKQRLDSGRRYRTEELQDAYINEKVDVYKNGNISSMFLGDAILETESSVLDANFLRFLRTPLSRKYKFFIYESFFDGEIARIIRERYSGQVLFMSDIRTSATSDIPIDEDIILNNYAQQQWARIINAKASHLKFRAPFMEGRTEVSISDILADTRLPEALRRDMSDYLIDLAPDHTVVADNILVPERHDIYLQCWAPIKSTEVRLVVEKDEHNALIPYSVKKHESKMFYFSSVLKTIAHFRNPLIIPKEGFDNAFNSSLEAHIWREYEEANGLSGFARDFIQRTRSIINRPGRAGAGYFRRSGEGILFYSKMGREEYHMLYRIYRGERKGILPFNP